MTSVQIADLPLTNVVAASRRSPLRWLHRAEDLFLTAMLTAMIVLPLIEIILRRMLHTGISGNSLLVQHLVMLVSMAGAAAAARESNLLALSTLDRVLPSGIGRFARIFSSAFSICVTVFLAYASYQFLATERESGKMLVYQLPTWIVELAFPIGFGAIAARV